LSQNKTIDRIYRDFKLAKEYKERKDFEAAMETADRMFKGHPFDEQAEKKMENDGIPVVQVSRGATNSLRLASIITANRPELKARAKGVGDGGVATLMGRAYKKVWDQNFGQKINFKGVLNCVKYGLDHFDLRTEKYGFGGDVKIKISNLGAKRVLYAPETSKNDLSDWPYRIVYRAISEKEAADEHGLSKTDMHYSAEPEMEDDKGVTHDSKPGGAYSDSNDGESREKKRNIYEIEYWTQRKQLKKVWFDNATQQYLPRISKSVKNSRDANILLTHAKNTPFSPMSMEERFEPDTIPERILGYTLVVGKKVKVNNKENPYGVDRLGEFVDPVVPLANIPIGELYPRGNLYLAEGGLKELAKRRGQSIAVVSYTMGSPIFFFAGTLDKSKVDKDISKPKSTHEIDTDDPALKPFAIYQNIPDLSKVFELENRARTDVDDAFNLTPILKGEAETGRMSGKLAAMLKEFGMEGNSYFLANSEEAFRKKGICICVMALNEWPFEYWERLLEEEDYIKENGIPTKNLLPDIEVALKKIKNKDVSIIDYDIGIRSGSSLPDNKMMKLNMAMELATMQVDPSAPADAEYVMEKIDDPAAKAVLKRKNTVLNLNGQIQKMQADMEKTIQHLEEATNESREKDDIIAAMTLKNVEKIAQVKKRGEISLAKKNIVIEDLRKKLNQKESNAKQT
jgi:hypothetical protein